MFGVRGPLSAVGAATACLVLNATAWAADDGSAESSLLPEPAIVEIRSADGPTPGPGPASGDASSKSDSSDHSNQADQLDDFEHYTELREASEALEDYLDDLDYGASNGTGALILPGLGAVTSEYGPRVHPIHGEVGFHTGLDFGAGDGVIYAADAGTVVQAAHNDAYGYFVILDHGMVNGERLTTMYAHQPDLEVTTGQRVSKGQPIGKVGSTGLSTGPHLHFEVRLDGTPANPVTWFPPMPMP